MMSEKLAALSATESNRLQGLERVIARTQASFIECGEALVRIRDERLYRQTHDTFAAYCEDKWKFSRSRAYALMAASEVAQNVNQLVDIPLKESQARALATVPPAERAEVMARAQNNGMPLTAARIRAAKTDVVLDHTGTVIPSEILEEWQRAEAFGEYLRMVSELKGVISAGLGKDIIFAEMTNLTMSTLTNLYSDLKRVIPYAVCPTCAGHRPKDRCAMCKGRGWMSEFFWKSIVPREIKDLRNQKVQR